MKTLTKALVGTVAASAMALGMAAPAQAQYRDSRSHDGIDVGDVIAGALIIGGIAAVASGGSRNNGGYYNDRGYNGGYYNNNGYNGRYDERYDNRAGDSRQAVEQCVNAAQQNASRYSYGGQARVTDIRKIDRKRDGYKVEGRIAVNSRGRDYRRGDSRYGSGWNNDYRGYNSRYAGYDSGTFKCEVRYGRVVDLDYSGIRGL
ncbi:MAG: hypothetical protein ABIT16_09530 [Croceibacterium sp.]